MNQTPKESSARSILSFRKKAVICLIFLIVALFPGYTLYGQSNSTESTQDISIRPAAFKHLWANQSHLNIGIFGCREVSETDIFVFRHINPNGVDFSTFESRTVTTRHGYYPLFSGGGATHHIFRINQRDNLAIHAEFSGAVFYQKIIIPSASYNTITGESHYPVYYYNTPSILEGSVRGGLWFFELLSLGTLYSQGVYHVNTGDDRMVQKDYKAKFSTIAPYTALWIPLEFTPMKRWSAKLTMDASGFGFSGNDFGLSSAEVALFRVSMRRTGRVTGFFARYFRPGATGIRDRSSGHEIEKDAQILVGVSIGSGGLNKNRGR